MLVVDLPPGTGDVPLSLAQAVVVDGGVVVTTPQRLAVQEAEKAVEMFRKLEVPVLGVVENMSHARCGCGRASHPFGRGGGAALATRQGVPLLGELPFEEPALADAECRASAIADRPARCARARLRGGGRHGCLGARERAESGGAAADRPRGARPRMSPLTSTPGPNAADRARRRLATAARRGAAARHLRPLVPERRGTHLPHPGDRWDHTPDTIGLSMVDWKPIMGVIPPVGHAEWEEAFARYRQFPEYQTLRAGMTLAEFQFIFFWEYLHRLAARVIGVVFLVPFLAFWARGYLNPPLLRRAMLLFALGALQGFVGWFMVKSGLVDDPRVSHFRLAAHLAVALSILALCTWLALEMRAQPARAAHSRREGARAVYLLGALLLAQILWGAFVAGLHAGLLYNTFPRMDGRLLPPPWGASSFLYAALENPGTVQWVHRVLGTLLVVGAAARLRTLPGPPERGLPAPSYSSSTRSACSRCCTSCRSRSACSTRRRRSRSSRSGSAGCTRRGAGRLLRFRAPGSFGGVQPRLFRGSGVYPKVAPPSRHGHTPYPARSACGERVRRTLNLRDMRFLLAGLIAPELPSTWLPDALRGPRLDVALALAVLLFIAGCVLLVARSYVLPLLHALARRTRASWDDAIFEYQAPRRAAALLPLLVLQIGIEWVPGISVSAAALLQRFITAAMIWVVLRSLDALLSGAHALYARSPRPRPGRSRATCSSRSSSSTASARSSSSPSSPSQSPWFFVSGLGAMMAMHACSSSATRCSRWWPACSSPPTT